MSKKLTIEECQLFAINKGGKCLSNNYKNKEYKLEWKCVNGHIWKASFGKVKHAGRWCPYCAKVAKHTIDECRSFAIIKGGKCLSAEYNNNNVKLLWQCKNGHNWYANFDSIMRGGWCAYCQDRAKLTIDKCNEIARIKKGKCLSLEYNNNKQKIEWQCENGHRWFASFSSIKNNNTWCPDCQQQISKAQKEIYYYLITTFPQMCVVLNDTKTIKPFDLDIYIPELKFAIEYDGEYWHYSDWAIKYGSLKRIKKKNLVCENRKIKLLRIREKEWKINKLLVLQKINDFVIGLY